MADKTTKKEEMTKKEEASTLSRTGYGSYSGQVPDPPVTEPKEKIPASPVTKPKTTTKTKKETVVKKTKKETPAPPHTGSGSEPEVDAPPVTVASDGEHGAQWEDSGLRKKDK